MKAIGYLRVSSEKQAESGLGLEAQREAIERFCERTGLQLVSIHQDAAVSGKTPLADRPALLSAINEMKQDEIKLLIVWRMDRLSRSMMISLGLEQMLKKFGGRIISCNDEGTADDEPTSIMMRRIFQSFGEYEAALISARTSAAMAAAKQKGQPVGRLPLGFERVSKTEWTTNHLFNQVAAVLYCKINRWSLFDAYPDTEDRQYGSGFYRKERRRWTAILVSKWMNEQQEEIRWTPQKVRNIWKRYDEYSARRWVAPYRSPLEVLQAEKGHWLECARKPQPVRS